LKIQPRRRDKSPPKDPAFYGNAKQVKIIDTDLWKNLEFPLSSNSVTRKQIRQIMCNLDVDSANDFIPQVRNPLEHFEFDDTRV
jgi:hypothetical protein